MSTIKTLLKEKKAEFNHESSSLDVDILLAHVLDKPRSFLYAWPDYEVESGDHKHFVSLVKRRIAGEPIAYLIGYKEFYGREFLVTADVLIPRPETELLIDAILEKQGGLKRAAILDLGTGTGAIALTLKAERPTWQVSASDISNKALSIAKKNAMALDLDVTFFESDWFQSIDEQSFDIIVSNPPYIAKDDPDLAYHVEQYEPHEALIAEQDGFAAYDVIFEESLNYLKSGGLLIVEHGRAQAASLRERLAALPYVSIETLKDLAGHDRVTLAIKQ